MSVRTLSSFAVVVALACATGARAQDGGDADAGDVDAGEIDAGDVDAGEIDAGEIDAGFADAGFVDAGFADAGFADAGTVVDAGDVVDGGAAADGGLADGGACGFAPFCDDDELVFCDGLAEDRVDCADVHDDARCGLLNDEWGFDCLLPEGAACFPGYAGGASRCDPEDAPYCTEGVCSDDEPGPTEPPDPTPGSGALVPSTTESSSFFSCESCQGGQQGALLFGAFLLALRRRRRP